MRDVLAQLTCIVDQDVEPPQQLDALLNQLLACLHLHATKHPSSELCSNTMSYCRVLKMQRSGTHRVFIQILGHKERPALGLEVWRQGCLQALQAPSNKHDIVALLQVPVRAG